MTESPRIFCTLWTFYIDSESASPAMYIYFCGHPDFFVYTSLCIFSFITILFVNIGYITTLFSQITELKRTHTCFVEWRIHERLTYNFVLLTYRKRRYIHMHLLINLLLDVAKKLNKKSTHHRIKKSGLSSYDPCMHWSLCDFVELFCQIRSFTWHLSIYSIVRILRRGNLFTTQNKSRMLFQVNIFTNIIF